MTLICLGGESSLIISILLLLIVNVIILFLISYIGIMFSKLNKLNAIHIRQYFVSMLSTVVISAFLPTVIAAAIFLVLFFLYRMVIFRRDSLEEQRIYSLYDGKVDKCRPIKNFHEFWFFKYEDNQALSLQREYRYSFSRYLNNVCYIFLFYCAKDVVNSGNAILFGIEYFVAVTALFVVLAKAVYHLSLNTPSSLFFLCPNLSYIPVVLSGLLFYFLAILIFLNIL